MCVATTASCRMLSGMRYVGVTVDDITSLMTSDNSSTLPILNKYCMEIEKLNSLNFYFLRYFQLNLIDSWPAHFLNKYCMEIEQLNPLNFFFYRYFSAKSFPRDRFLAYHILCMGHSAARITVQFDILWDYLFSFHTVILLVLRLKT